MWTCPHCDGTTDDEFQICWSCRIPRGQSANFHECDRVLVTSTPTLCTHSILEYVGPVFGETVYGANFFRDFASGFTDMFGGRSQSYESILIRGRNAAIHEMQIRAERLGCNAIVGLVVQYDPIGDSMFMICASGTAVRVTTLDGTDEETLAKLSGI
ncbi:MAG: YbjQ family protein [Pirellulaceae bacterium]